MNKRFSRIVRWFGVAVLILSVPFTVFAESWTYYDLPCNDPSDYGYSEEATCTMGGISTNSNLYTALADAWSAFGNSYAQGMLNGADVYAAAIGQLSNSDYCEYYQAYDPDGTFYQGGPSGQNCDDQMIYGNLWAGE